MKKILCIALSLVLALLCACSSGTSGASGKKVVNVYNWGEYIDTGVLSMFEEETGIKVNYKTFENNESLYSVLKGGGASYDVIIPSDYMISRMIDEDMLEPLNYNNIPNFSLLDTNYLGLEFDAENTYSVPYMWGTVGIIYNTTMIEGEITSWCALFDEAYSGQILMFDNSRDAFGIALKYLGYSFNTTNEAEIQEAYELLESQKPLVQAYVMDQIFDKMSGNEAAIGPYYAGDFLVMQEENPDLAYCAPVEGANIFVDSMCIPKGAENKENAEAFINFMCRTDVSLMNSEETGYATPSADAYSQLDDETRENDVLYPSAEVLSKCESFLSLPSNILSLYDSLWIKLKS